MPRNRSEKAPVYSPEVTAWLIAWHRLIRIRDMSSLDEKCIYDAMSIVERVYWGSIQASILDPLAKQVYDAQKSK